MDRFNHRDYFGLSNPVELNLYLERIMIRRKKDEVLTELPEMRREKIMVEVKKSEMKKIKAVMENIKSARQKMEESSKDNNRKGVNSEGGKRKSLYTQLFRDTGLGKMAAISKFIEDKLEDNSKFLIFAHHKTVMDGIEQLVKKKKVEYIKIDGTTPAHARSNLVNIFQTDEKIKVAILSITAAGTGLTLTAASVAIFAELYWTPGVLMQAEARVHRFGQNRSVLIQYLVGINTIDESIWSMLESKKDVLGRILDGESDTLEFEKGEQILQSTPHENDSIWESIIQSVEDRDSLRKKKIDAKKERQARREQRKNAGEDDESKLDNESSYLDDFLGDDNNEEEEEEEGDEENQDEDNDDYDQDQEEQDDKKKKKTTTKKSKTSSTTTTATTKKVKAPQRSTTKKRGASVKSSDNDTKKKRKTKNDIDLLDEENEESDSDPNNTSLSGFKDPSEKSSDTNNKKQRLSASSEIVVDMDEDFEDSLLVSDFDKLEQFKFKAGF
ncbi:SNF2-related domain-containing protein [Heterostelium album PN500]|uniref:SNF2-related domain-containing protein n=1 Tax=Heterostelium pallidum (strain ATCC 26659 / Pp 5 / PN500) TaxID=670386 RepID=D3B7Z4_HETP5|nr:SNF2-related domain-containing protein [Heterostelium album PN500]EFA82162.1 SNF2-related domain-containing protein [Heterostelium album PN500]|eukprot:XP_020434279.1 SNF2-related domain-containing protein [Heterostelium album PN500]